MVWIAGALFVVSGVAGIDAKRNPESWRELGLMIQDGCRYLWFYPQTVQVWMTKLKRAYRHKPRHATTFEFTSTWHLL